MAKFLERMKGAWKQNRGPQKLPPGSYPNSVGNAQTLGTITKPSYQTDDDDEEEDNESLKNYNVPEQTRLRGPPINTIPSDDIHQNRNAYGTPLSPRSDPINSSNPAFRGASSGFVFDAPMNNNFNNNNMNPSSNMDSGAAPDLPSRPSFAFPPQPQDPSSRPSVNPQQPFAGFPPGMNSNQPPPPSSNNPPPTMGGFPPGMNFNQPPPPSSNNPPPTMGGFPPGMNPNQPPPPPSNNPPPTMAGFPPGMNPNQPPPPSSNNPQAAMTGFPPGMNLNQRPPSNNPQAGMTGFPPGMNLNQPPPSNNPQAGMTGFPPGMNLNQSSAPPQNNPQQPFTGFPPGLNSRPSNVQTNDPMNPQQGILSKPSSSFRSQSNNQDDNVSRLELDYPIENVLIDANIPSAVAVKINDAVEQDRLGNAYHIHRYTFEPSEPQHLSFNNQRQTGSSFHGGTRHIRELHDDHQNPLFNDLSHSSRPNKHSRRRHHYYSETALDQYINQLLQTPGSTIIEARNHNDLQSILNQQLVPTQTYPTQPSITPFQSNTDALNGPVFYYTARALHNDPMRNY